MRSIERLTEKHAIIIHSNLDLRAINLRVYLNLRANFLLSNEFLLNKNRKFKISLDLRAILVLTNMALKSRLVYFDF